MWIPDPGVTTRDHMCDIHGSHEKLVRGLTPGKNHAHALDQRSIGSPAPPRVSVVVVCCLQFKTPFLNPNAWHRHYWQPVRSLFFFFRALNGRAEDPALSPTWEVAAGLVEKYMQVGAGCVPAVQAVRQ
jgi:hypothetical protein